jgi:hypothetical protein
MALQTIIPKGQILRAKALRMTIIQLIYGKGKMNWEVVLTSSIVSTIVSGIISLANNNIKIKFEKEKIKFDILSNYFKQLNETKFPVNVSATSDNKGIWNSWDYHNFSYSIINIFKKVDHLLTKKNRIKFNKKIKFFEEEWEKSDFEIIGYIDEDDLYKLLDLKSELILIFKDELKNSIN